MFDYSDYYATLGATSDTDWETLRANYRRLIGQWHPDRFSDDPASRRVAEERSKRITIAYQMLEKYRRDHGVLPPIGPEGYEPMQTAAFGRSGFEAPAKMDNSRTPLGELARLRRQRLVAGAISVLIAALYLAYHYRDEWAPVGTANTVHEPDIEAQAPRTADSPRQPIGISIGSTMGEVYAAQGVPTSTEGDTWHYGNSQIRFSRGKVISWSEHAASPFRTARDQPIQLRGGHFGVGSTKDEVRAIQGTPVTETESVWDYGPSQVYFEHNRVSGWQESTVQHLRVRR